MCVGINATITIQQVVATEDTGTLNVAVVVAVHFPTGHLLFHFPCHVTHLSRHSHHSAELIFLMALKNYILSQSPAMSYRIFYLNTTFSCIH